MLNLDLCRAVATLWRRVILSEGPVLAADVAGASLGTERANENRHDILLRNPVSFKRTNYTGRGLSNSVWMCPLLPNTAGRAAASP